MDYMSEYKRWLDCSALSADEHAELAAVADNQEEIESRFFAPLSSARPVCAVYWASASTA